MSKKQIITEYRPYDLSVTFPVLLLTGERWHISDIKSDRLHFHNCLEIGICLNGHGYMDFSGREQAFQAGDIVCIPRNLPHTTYSTPSTQSLWTYLFFDTESLFQHITPNSALISELSMEDVPHFQYMMPGSDYSKIYFFAVEAVKELEQKPLHYQTSVPALLFNLCLEILRIQKQPQSSLIQSSQISQPDYSFLIAPALDYIFKNYMYEFTVEDLAKLCHLSETHFRRIFQTSVGTSPLDFVNNTRIQKACALLKTTSESVLYISEQVGFRSISSFNRCFIKAMGAPPREWKKQTLFSEGKSEPGSVIEYKGWL